LTKITTNRLVLVGIGLFMTHLFTTTVHASNDFINNKQINNNQKIKIATFNVSMEALNYIPYHGKTAPKVTGNELQQALNNNHQQIKNIAEIIQRINPDIILLNEFDRTSKNHQEIKTFIQKYLNVSQNEQTPINFPYYFQGSVNTGVKTPFDLNHNSIEGEVPQDTYGFGYFPGHYGMALLSKHPIDTSHIRTFQLFKWRDMPNALEPFNPETKQSYYSAKAWNGFRLSSKSHWDIPVKINNNVIHILASHPTPPVFDGSEDRNGKRNHDEIRFWYDYITPNKGTYIYDDNDKFGGLAQNNLNHNSQQRFIILGDQNASNIEGDAIHSGINLLLTSKLIQDANPKSLGAKAQSKNNINGEHHTASWGMRADYILPSTFGLNIFQSGVFWPTMNDKTFRLIKDRAASSDHRLVWMDLNINNKNNALN